jgi:hopene-associated glycosyltransferase HpnB
LFDGPVAWLALAVLAFWIGLWLDRRRAWPAGHRLLGGDDVWSAEAAGGVLVVVPARDEAEVLSETLPALLAQSASFSLLVLADDRSTDETAALARELAAGSADLSRVAVVSCPEPPPGWMGKMHGLATGLAAGQRLLRSRGGELPEWVLFTDADIRHRPGSIAALLEQAHAERRDMVSVMVRLRAVSLWEKLLVPPFVWFFQLLYPFRAVADPASRVAAAAGGCVLLRRELLERSGGIEAIRGEVIDDVALAWRVKRAGGRLWLGFDAGMLSVRGYGTLAEVTRMVARSAFHQLRYSYCLLALTIAGLGLFLVSPPVLCALGISRARPGVAIAAGAAWLLQGWLFAPAVRHHRVPWPFALSLPLGSLLYAWMTLVSAWRHLTRQGGEWKGRRLTPRLPASAPRSPC